MKWIVRQFWPLISGGTDESLEDAERVDADDPEEAAEKFMERVEETGDLYEWIGDNNACTLLVRAAAETSNDPTDHVIAISVDWSPNFYANEVPSLAEVDPSLPSCERESCKHPESKHVNGACGVLHCRCPNLRKKAP